MLDFALHGWDLAAALGLSGRRLALDGHSLGGVIAAEMACLAPQALDRLVLVDAFDLWLDDHPIPDLITFLPFEFADRLFSDPGRAAALLTRGSDFSDDGAVKDFLVSKGVSADRIETVGAGGESPLVPNLGPANQAKNRRVELVVVQ